MSVLSHYCRNKLFEQLLGLSSFSKPTIYIGLSTTDPAQGSPTEPSSADYNRVRYSRWSVLSSRRVCNNTTISFYTRSAWGTVSYYLLWDAQVGGNLLGYGPISPIVVTDNKDVLSFSKNQLVFQVDSGTATDYISNVFLQHLFGNVSLTSSSFWVGLSYTDPGASGSPIRPVNGEYRDVNYQNWSVSDISELTNTGNISFPVPTHDWGIIPYVFLRDGNNRVMFYSVLMHPLHVDPFNSVTFNPADLTFIFD